MKLLRLFLFFSLLFALVACGDDATDAGDAATPDDDAGSVDAGSDAARTFAVGGTVFGLAGTGLVLDNLGETLPVGVDGPFAFGKRFAKDAAYNVTVKSQPTNPTQTCVVSSGMGTVGNTDVAS